MENTSENPISSLLSEALLKLKKEEPKEGINLLDITKKLSHKKFEKKK